MKKGYMVLFMFVLCLTHGAIAGAEEANEPIEASTETSTWMSVFGGKNQDVGMSVTPTSDGGYLAVGFSKSIVERGKRGWLVKVNANGEKIWEKGFRETSDSIITPVEEILMEAVQAPDGEFCVVGVTEKNDYSKCEIARIYENGDIKWLQILGKAKKYSSCTSVDVTSNGDCIYAGSLHYGRSEAWIFRYDAEGKEVSSWKSADLYNYEKIRQTSDGGYILSSASSVTEKRDGEGKIEWNVKKGGVQIETKSGDYILAGSSRGDDAVEDIDAWYGKIDATGNLLWDKLYDIDDGRPILGESFRSVVETRDGGYLFAGNVWIINVPCYAEGFLLKVDKDGNPLWQRIIGGDGQERFTSIIRAHDSGYIISGETSSSCGEGSNDMLLMKVDEEGNCGNCKF